MRPYNSSIQRLTLPVFSIILVSGATDAAVFLKGAAWKDAKVSVCFASPSLREKANIDELYQPYGSPDLKEWSEDWMRLIRETVVKEYSKDTTGIEFTGWKKCDGEEPLSTVYIFSFDFFYVAGISTIGETPRAYHSVHESIGFGRSEGEILVPAPNSSTFTILHEFGHLSGLIHEHARPEARSDIHCAGNPNIAYANETLAEDDIALWAYDPFSIMNYCYKSYFLNLKTTTYPSLSDLDRRVLKQLYPNP